MLASKHDDVPHDVSPSSIASVLPKPTTVANRKRSAGNEVPAVDHKMP